MKLSKKELFEGLRTGLTAALRDRELEPLHRGITTSIRPRETSAFRPTPRTLNVEHDYVFRVR